MSVERHVKSGIALLLLLPLTIRFALSPPLPRFSFLFLQSICSFFLVFFHLIFFFAHFLCAQKMINEQQSSSSSRKKKKKHMHIQISGQYYSTSRRRRRGRSKKRNDRIVTNQMHTHKLIIIIIISWQEFRKKTRRFNTYVTVYWHEAKEKNVNCSLKSFSFLINQFLLRM